MDTKTELLLDYQEMAILALRAEVERLTLELKECKEQNDTYSFNVDYLKDKQESLIDELYELKSKF